MRLTFGTKARGIRIRTKRGNKVCLQSSGSCTSSLNSEHTHCNLITIYIKYVVGVLELEDVKTYHSLQLDYNLH
jgi:hypothetical protein